jgi:TonB family protein
MLLFVGKLREAFETYQKILLADAANANALAGAGVSLINLGFDSGDKTSLDQGIEYLSRFVSEATSKHPLKASVEEALRYLKKQKVPFLKGDEPTPGTIEGGTVTGKALNLAPSPYPAIAAFAHVQGRVPVRVLIDEDGNVENAQAEGGHPLLQAAAVTAAFRAKFSPTIQSGKPVKVRGIIYYSFVDN